MGQTQGVAALPGSCVADASGRGPRARWGRPPPASDQVGSRRLHRRLVAPRPRAPVRFAHRPTLLRDKIGPAPRDLGPAHEPVRGLLRGARSTATRPDPVDFGPCLGTRRTCPRGQVASETGGTARARVTHRGGDRRDRGRSTRSPETDGHREYRATGSPRRRPVAGCERVDGRNPAHSFELFGVSPRMQLRWPGEIHADPDHFCRCVPALARL